MVGGFFFTKATGSNPKPDGPARAYEYQYSGTMMYPITYYQVKRDGDGAVRIAYLEDVRSYENPNGPDMIVIPGPEDFFGQVDAIVSQYKLHRLRGTYTPRADVLDGYMWHAYIRFEKNSISSGGSNAWPPEKLRAGIDAINGYIQSLIDASTEADVIGHDDHDSLYNRKYRH